MALNQEEYQSLKNAKFLELYSDDKSYWDEVTREAYRYTLKIIPKEERVRQDDVATFLTPTIRQDPKFIKYCQKNRSMQKYWCKWFADLLIDIYFSEHKTRGNKKGGGK